MAEVRNDKELKELYQRPTIELARGATIPEYYKKQFGESLEVHKYEFQCEVHQNGVSNPFFCVDYREGDQIQLYYKMQNVGLVGFEEYMDFLVNSQVFDFASLSAQYIAQ